MINLPSVSRNRATFRILYMQEGQWANQSWTALPVPMILTRSGTQSIMGGTVAQGGYQVGSISRWCLPDEDRAEFYIDTGTINGEEVDYQSLNNCAIRIQVYDDESFPSTETTLPVTGWKTVFVGTVISIKHQHHPGLDNFGRVTYYCAGVLWRTRNWPMDRHSDASAYHAKGHPGYNIPLHGLFRQVLGNKGTGNIGNDPYGDLGSFTSYYYNHKLPLGGVSGASKWTDEEAIQHALVSSRAAGEPLIATDLSAGMFSHTYAWPISAGETCWDFLRRVCNRNRGRGSVFVEYTDADSSMGDVTLTLKCYAPFASDLEYTIPSDPSKLDMDAEVVIHSRGDGAVDVDINGDHRITDNGFVYEDRYSSKFDAIVVQGEKIQVLCNLNFFGGSLSKGWTDADQTAFNAIPIGQTIAATSSRWTNVYRRYILENSEDYNVMAQTDSVPASINYFTDKNGVITSGNSSVTHGLSSSLCYRILPDLPIYKDWRYDGVYPERYDGGTDYLPPGRQSPVVLYKTEDTDSPWTWFPLTKAGFNVQSDDFGLLITNAHEDVSGVRLLADSTSNWFRTLDEVGVPTNVVNTVSGLDLQKLNTIVGVELGSRVSITKTGFGVTTYEDAGKRLTMTVNGLSLWLGAPGAIWDMDTTRAGQSGYTPGLTMPADQSAYIIRDDRVELAFIAALAWSYYGATRNPGTWGLYDCGFISGFHADAGFTNYPTLGQLVGTVTYCGKQGDETKVGLNTPITSIHYDHEAGETTWRTDYISYDGQIQ